MFNWLRHLFARDAAAGDKPALPDSIDVRIVDGVTIATFTKSPSVEDAKQAIRYLGTQKIYRRRIWDMREIDFPYTVDQLRELAYFGRETLGGSNKIGLVVKDTVGYGSSRAFATYREGDNVADARVFKSMDEALQWIHDDS